MHLPCIPASCAELVLSKVHPPNAPAPLVIEIRNDWQMNQTCTAQADYIGWGCFASYSLLIPGFLVYLIVRQRKVMTPIDHFVCFATADREKRNFQVSVRASLEEGDKTRAAMKDGVCCFSQILL